MQHNKRPVAKWCSQGDARRKWKDGPLDLRKPETSKDSQIAQDSMLTANDRDHLVIEPAGALARIADSNGTPGVT